MVGRRATEDLPRDGVVQGCLNLIVHLLGLFWTRLAGIVQLVLVTGGGVGHDGDVLLTEERCG